ARPTKFATVLGASLSNMSMTISPLLVSMCTVVPIGSPCRELAGLAGERLCWMDARGFARGEEGAEEAERHRERQRRTDEERREREVGLGLEGVIGEPARRGQIYVLGHAQR